MDTNTAIVSEATVRLRPKVRHLLGSRIAFLVAAVAFLLQAVGTQTAVSPTDGPSGTRATITVQGNPGEPVLLTIGGSAVATVIGPNGTAVIVHWFFGPPGPVPIQAQVGSAPPFAISNATFTITALATIGAVTAPAGYPQNVCALQATRPVIGSGLTIAFDPACGAYQATGYFGSTIALSFARPLTPPIPGFGGAQGTLLLQPQGVFLRTDPFGQTPWAIPLPNSASLTGLPMTVQGALFGMGLQVLLTDGVTGVLGTY